MTDKTTDNLAAALASVQAQLPKVHKGKTADTGKYAYNFADLAACAEAIHPLLGAAGLAFITKPTLNADGQFVLAYKLMHVSGEEECGEYPLPDPVKVTPQQIGSAITYSRRYSLCAVTGIAPEDDDGAAANDTKAKPRKAERQSRSGPPADDPWSVPEGQLAPTAPNVEAVTDAPWFDAWQQTVNGCKDLAQLAQLWNDAIEARRERRITEADFADALILKDLQKAEIERAAEQGWPEVAQPGGGAAA